jgi:putative membrane protein
MRLTLAALHLLALGLGLGAVWSRAGALRGTLDKAGLRRVFSADAWWGLAAALWLSTGLARLFMGTEKTTSYYMTNPMFHAKMGLFLVILLLEIWPMMVLIRWRRQVARDGTVDTSPAPRLATVSRVEAALVVVIVFVAVAMARGYGAS